LFCGNVGGPIDFALHAPQVFQVATAGLASQSALVALDCIVNLKQLGIVGMNGHPLCNPCQGCE
jgi:hypothetical protein